MLLVKHLRGINVSENETTNPAITVGLGDLLGCGYYRCAVPYKELSKEGFDVELTNKLHYDPDSDTHLTGVNALVLQRQHSVMVMEIAKLMQAKGQKIVFELDDYFHDIPRNNPAGQSYLKGGEQVQNIEKFLQMADLVTVSTVGLKEQYSKYNANIHVCPNQLAGEDILNEEIEPYTGGEFRLGWAGSSTHYDDFLTIVKPLSDLMLENPNINFYFIGHDYRKLLHPNVQKRCFHLGHTFPIENGKALFYAPDGVNPVLRYYDLLKSAKLHAAIAPLLQVTFNRCKSYVKLMEYGLAGIPWIATNFGPYQLYTQQAVQWDRNRPVGAIADRNPEWKRSIKRMMTDEPYRQSLIKNNFDFLKDKHIIRQNIQLWKNAFASIGIYPGSTSGKFAENLVKSQ
jgi:hypothetical protein